MKKFQSIILLLCASLFFACSNDKPSEVSKDLDAEKELEEKTQEPVKKHLDKAYYPIPSPEQMIGFINDNGIAYSQELTNSKDNLYSYTTPSEKALNFGVYTADLAYAAAYEDIKSTISLYKVVRQLGADLDIEEMMTEEMMNDIQAHLQEKDSLTIIAGRSYYEAVEYLEQNELQGKLALMSLGGWIESLYITVNAVGEFEEDSKTAQRIADQKITFGNLYTYLKKNEDQMGVAEQIEKIQGIRGVFGSLVEKKMASSKGNNEGGKMVFGAGKKIHITAVQFEELKQAINEYRAEITAQAV